MAPGDFILTPNWAPHDHGNPGKKPMMWLDVLDMPTVNHFETSFMEHFDEKAQNTNRARRRIRWSVTARACCRTAPMDTYVKRSPIINYTYARTRPIVERLMKAGDIDPRAWRARALLQPGHRRARCMPTMGAYLAHVPEGLQGQGLPVDRRHRSSSASKATADQGRRQGAGVGPERRVRRCRRGTNTRTTRRRRRCCSRSPTSRRRKRSASGASGSKPRSLHWNCRAPPKAGHFVMRRDQRCRRARLSAPPQMIEHQERDAGGDADEVDGSSRR